MPEHPQTLQGGRYQVIRLLGQGGFGVTYLARDALLDRQVVIKELFPQGSLHMPAGLQLPPQWSGDAFDNLLGRFVGEARMLAKFKSPHVVRVQDVFTELGTAFIIMDYLEGRTLMQRLRDEGPLSPALSLRMARHLAQALTVVHDAGLLHRDIKPDNIYLLQDDTPVLIDFGASREYADSNQQMSVILTHGFAPPEQYGGTGPFGPPTDLYALAATLLFAVTGKLPPNAVTRLHDQESLPAVPSTYAPGFRRALLAALEVRAIDRPSSAQAFVELLEGGLDDLGALQLVQRILEAGATTALHAPERQRLWALALLAVSSRRDGQVPRIQHPDELRYALKRSADVVPLFHDGLELAYGSVISGTAKLQEDLEAFTAHMFDHPEQLGSFLGELTKAASLTSPAVLNAPGPVWQAPSTQKSLVLPSFESVFKDFKLQTLPVGASHSGFAQQVQAAWLIQGSDLRIIHAVSGEESGRIANVHAAAAVDNGLWLALNGALRRYDFQGHPISQPLDFPDHPVALAAWRGQGVTQLAAIGRHGLFSRFNVKGDQISAQDTSAVSTREQVPVDLFYSADGLLLLLQAAQSVTVLHTKTGKILRTFHLSGQAITGAAITADGKQVCTAHGRLVVVWDMLSGKELRSFRAPAAMRQLFFSANGAYLGGIGEDDRTTSLYLFKAASGQPMARSTPSGGHALSAAIGLNGRALILSTAHQLNLMHLAPLPYHALPQLGMPVREMPPEATPDRSVTPASVQPASAAGPLSSPASSALPGSTLTVAGVRPYQEVILPTQSTTNLLNQPLDALEALMALVVQTEGPVHRQEAYRRVVQAHTLGKVGSQIGARLDLVTQRAAQRGLIRVCGDFLWLSSMQTPPVRNRSLIKHRSLTLVCDEEIRVAAELARTLMPGADASITAQLLGFSKLSAEHRKRIDTLMIQERI